MSKVQAGPITADRLKSFVERIERLEEERKAIGGDIRDIYSEAKGVGYDVKTLRKVVQLRKMDAADRDEQEQLLDVYWHALTTVDRIEERAAAGETAREIAAAEGVSKSTAHRVSQKARGRNDNEKTGQDHAPGNSAHEGEDDGRVQAVPPEADRRASPVEPAGRHLACERLGAGQGSGIAEAGRHDRPQPEEPSGSVAGGGAVLCGQLRTDIATSDERSGLAAIMCAVDDGKPCPNTCARDGRCVWAGVAEGCEPDYGGGASTSPQLDTLLQGAIRPEDLPGSPQQQLGSPDDCSTEDAAPTVEIGAVAEAQPQRVADHEIDLTIPDFLRRERATA